MNKKQKWTIISIKLNESDSQILDFLIKMFKTNKSEIFRKSIRLLKQDVITGRFDGEIG